MQDSQVALSPDGKRIVFIRESSDKDGNWGPSAIATMDLESGQVAVLNSTTLGAAHPGWSPDGSQIVFFRYGQKDSTGPDPVINDAVMVIDADGQNLHQVSPTTTRRPMARMVPRRDADRLRVRRRGAPGRLHDSSRTGPTCDG